MSRRTPESPTGNDRSSQNKETVVLSSRDKIIGVIILGIVAVVLLRESNTPVNEASKRRDEAKTIKIDPKKTEQKSTPPASGSVPIVVEKKEPTSKPNENPAEKYLGQWRAHYEFLKPEKVLKISVLINIGCDIRANVAKLDIKKPLPQTTMSLQNGKQANLMIPIETKINYDCKPTNPLFQSDKNQKKGAISSTGGIYDLSGEHLIISKHKEIGGAIVLGIRERNRQTEVSVPSSYNSKKISSKLSGWLAIKRASR